MRRKSTPATGAERQRAYRERHKDDLKPPPAPLEGELQEDLEPGIDDEVSLAALNARLRRWALQALKDEGGVAYLRRIAGKSPNTFLRFVSQFVIKEESINPGAFNIYVQELTINGAQPVSGVLCSPVAGHIDVAARTPLPPVAEVIEQEPQP